MSRYWSGFSGVTTSVTTGGSSGDIKKQVSDFIGGPDRIRTCDPQFRKLMLYPAELRDLAG